MPITIGRAIPGSAREGITRYPIVRHDGRIIFVHVHAPDDARIMVPSPRFLAQVGASMTEAAALACVVKILEGMA